MVEQTGIVAEIAGEQHLVLTRAFEVAPRELWRWLTESERLSRWIGHWEGDPATGQVDFYMTAEGEVVDPEHYQITECDPPRRFAGDTSQGEGAWHLWFEIAEKSGGAILRFGQRLEHGEDVGSIGPGWEYYLDRLAAVIVDRNADSVVWEDYFPVLSAGYLQAREASSGSAS